MHTVYVEGLAFWSSRLPGWELARAALRGEAAPAEVAAKRPVPQFLPPAERRRLPDTVALALEVAFSAVTQSGRDAASLPSVFVSAHGDLAINDHLCTTLASNPTLISPTKFHNSVLNAAGGYWSITTGCHEACTALTAFEHSFGAGWLEAATQVAADGQAVLLVGFDTEACGALVSVTRSQDLLAVALVLAPARTPHSLAALTWQLKASRHTPPDGRQPTSPPSAAAQTLAVNAMADALPLFEALARGETESLDLPVSPTQALHISLQTLPAPQHLSKEIS